MGATVVQLDEATPNRRQVPLDLVGEPSRFRLRERGPRDGRRGR
jgi:hypothetical protein